VSLCEMMFGHWIKGLFLNIWTLQLFQPKFTIDLSRIFYQVLNFWLPLFLFFVHLFKDLSEGKSRLLNLEYLKLCLIPLIYKNIKFRYICLEDANHINCLFICNRYRLWYCWIIQFFNEFLYLLVCSSCIITTNFKMIIR